MKKILSVFTALFIIGNLFFPVVGFSAASGVVQLEITTPTSTRVGEAIDVTVRAVDKDKKTVSGYRGSIIFNTDNIGDTVPMPGKSYTFTADDNGEKKFSKGLVFKKSGKQKIYVSDVSEDIAGEATVSVDPGVTTTNPTDQSVTIITPENNTQITSDSVMVSGKARKNSKVNIKLNGKDIGSTTTDDTGIFTKNVSGISQENNILSAELVDGSNTSVATSPEVKFTRISTNSATYGITINPSTTVEVSSPIEVIIDATPGLSELSILLDGSSLVTKETSAGKYTVKTVAPSKPGTFQVQINQKDALGQSKPVDVTATLTTTDKLSAPQPNPAFKNVKTVTHGSRVTFTFSVENPPADLKSFKIAYGKDVNSLSSEVNTFTIDRIASKTESGAYTWYIDKLTPATYTFKIFGRNAEGTMIANLASDPIIATIGTDSCTIGNVGNIDVKTDTSKSIMSWETVSGAVSYNLYKISPSGEYTLFQNIKDPTYTLYLSKGAVTYDNFAVKALCDEKTESKEYSKMSRVQSGPGAIALLVIISAIASMILLRKRFI